MTLKINLMNKERLMALIFKCDHPVTRSPFSFYPSPYKKNLTRPQLLNLPLRSYPIEQSLKRFNLGAICQRPQNVDNS